MSNNTPDPNLQKLYRERDLKFDEIVSCLSDKRSFGGGPISDADHARLIEEAEELTDNWAAAEHSHRSQEPSTALQHLLNEHQLICRAIIEILDAGS